MNKKRYKFLRTGFKSNSGNHTWDLGKWYREESVRLCSTGYHCSKGIYQAFSYVQGEYLAEVEVKGEHFIDKDKEVYQEMRVIKIYEWTKTDSVLFSIFAARQVLTNFEKLYPDDVRPRLAIEAAENYVKDPTPENASAADSAADSAYSAADSAADSAAYSAYSAASSAADSAYSAASSAAYSAAYSAYSADSARKLLKAKFDKWMQKHLKNLKVVKEIK